MDLQNKQMHLSRNLKPNGLLWFLRSLLVSPQISSMKMHGDGWNIVKAALILLYLLMFKRITDGLFRMIIGGYLQLIFNRYVI